MSGRVVVITGASSGIGASLARQLGRRGDSVVLAARRETLLRQVASEAGANALVVDTPFHDVAGPGLTVKAGGFLGPTRVESADEVAERIVQAVDHPLPEVYTNPASLELASSYFKDVGAFEENLARRRGA